MSSWYCDTNTNMRKTSVAPAGMNVLSHGRLRGLLGVNTMSGFLKEELWGWKGS